MRKFSVFVLIGLMVGSLAMTGCAPTQPVEQEPAFENNFMKGKYYQKRGDYQKALNAFVQYKQEREGTDSPLLPATVLRIGECYEGLEQYDQAMEMYDQAIAMDPDEIGTFAKINKENLQQKLKRMEEEAAKAEEAAMPAEGEAPAEGAETTAPAEGGETTAPAEVETTE
jgi:tetratricopeptide (TPR) repeat protein